MILLDTGPIVAAAFTTERFHHECVELFTGLRLANREILIPATVTAVAGYLINRLGGPRDEASFLQGVGEGDLVPVNLIDVDYLRMAELVEQYADLPLGATDASVIALAERLGIAEVATLDRRHFTVVQPRHLDALTLLPERLVD
jgi:predicted nucleic acid-binding protein